MNARSRLLLGVALTGLWAAASPHSASAAMLASFPFTGSVYTDVAGAANLTVSPITSVGGTLGFNTGAAGFPPSPPFTAPTATLSGLDSAAGGYFTFTITPHAGYELQLDSFSFWGYAAGTEDFEASVWIDGVEVASLDGTVGETFALKTLPLNLTGIDGAVEFRIRGYDFLDSARTFRIDNVEVFGSLNAVPEPGAWALGGSGLLIGWAAFGLRQRRRWAAA